jgi:hypothetical protein
MKLKLKLKPIHFILLVVIFIVCLYQTIIKPSSIVEGYQSYDECVNQGYPLDFCLQVPPQAQV